MGDRAALSLGPAQFGVFDFAEICRKGELCFPGQRLVEEDDNMVSQQCIDDSLPQRARQRLRQISAGDRSAAGGRQPRSDRARLVDIACAHCPEPIRLALDNRPPARSKIGTAPVVFPIAVAGGLEAFRAADLARRRGGRANPFLRRGRGLPVGFVRTILHG